MNFISKIAKSHQVETIINELTEGLSGRYDLGILFYAYHNRSRIQEITKSLKSKLSISTLVGCTCAGVIGEKDEIEQQSAVSLLLMKLPNVSLTPFYIDQNQLGQLNTEKDWYQLFEIFPNENPVFITFPDPFMFDMNKFLKQLNTAYPKCPILGGLASASNEPNGNTLILNDKIYTDGIVGVILTGDISVSMVVSQGCRPIGETYIVTKSDGNVIYELAGKTFLQVLKEVLDKASAHDKLLAQEALLVGIAMDEYKHPFKRGDFLIRGLIGVDEKIGAGAIGDHIKLGQTIQFHVRDAQTATEDLNELLRSHQQIQKEEKPQGALVFSCNGRGQYLFKEKNHDINIIQSYVGPVPAAGFFCAGEIGPVGGSNFIHGFTDSIALFYPHKSKG